MWRTIWFCGISACADKLYSEDSFLKSLFVGAGCIKTFISTLCVDGRNFLYNFLDFTISR